MMLVAKLNGQLVQVITVTDTVQFSPDRGWVLVCTDFEQPNRKKSNFKWVPASTRFEWVKEFKF